MVRRQRIFSKMLPRTQFEPMNLSSDLKIITERPDLHPCRGCGINKCPQGQRGKEFYLGNLEKVSSIPQLLLAHVLLVCRLTVGTGHSSQAQQLLLALDVPSSVLLGLSVCLEPCVLSSGFCKVSTPPRSEAKGTDMGSRVHLHEVPARGWTVHPALDLAHFTSSFPSQWPALWDSSSSMRHEHHRLRHCLTSSHSHAKRRFEIGLCLFLSLYVHIDQ